MRLKIRKIRRDTAKRATIALLGKKQKQAKTAK